MDLFRDVFSCGLLVYYGELCDRCSLLIPMWDDHSTCVKCRFSVGLCSVDIHNPCDICWSWSLATWGRLRKSLCDARQKSTKRGTQHWSCQAPALLAWMNSASSSSELHSDTGSIADSDLREVDLELAAATAGSRSLYPSEFGQEGSRHCCRSGPDLNILTSMPLCAQLITCAHAPPLGISSNQLLLSSTSTTAPLLTAGPRFPPVTQGPISMPLGAPISFSVAPGMPGAPPAPCRALKRRISAYDRHAVV